MMGAVELESNCLEVAISNLLKEEARGLLKKSEFVPESHDDHEDSKDPEDHSHILVLGHREEDQNSQPADTEENPNNVSNVGGDRISGI